MNNVYKLLPDNKWPILLPVGGQIWPQREKVGGSR